MYLGAYSAEHGFTASSKKENRKGISFFLKVNKVKPGFTLIELLVVIAIIGILSSVVLASLNTARLKSRDARRISDIKQLQSALALYTDSNANTYPTTLAALVTAGFIAVIPNDPAGSGVAYKYAALGTGATCSSYHLGASLEEANNIALRNDFDVSVAATRCTGSATDFTGLDTAQCSSSPAGTVGVACYDLKP